LLNHSSFFSVHLTLHEGRPLIDRFLTLEALSSKVRETFVEWNFQHMIVNHPGPSLSKHPEVVTEDVPTKDIDRVVGSAKD
jgi:glutathione peroxidase-family protein